MQTIYSYAGISPSEARSVWAEMATREFYAGEMDSSAPPEFTLRKALSYPISLTHFVCGAPVAHRRTWRHIRNNRAGMRVIAFVKRGELRIARTQGATTVAAGEMGILDINSPFHARLLCDHDSIHESYQVNIPAHLFLRYLPEGENYTGSFHLETERDGLVQKLLELLVVEGYHLGRDTAERLAHSFLEAIGDSIRRRAAAPRRQNLVERRLADIESYILLNLGDPELSCESVAANCGMSRRYLCHVLKANKTSFSDFLWKNRLLMAEKALVAPNTRGLLIHEIAYLSGFKSAAHFSRMFKMAHGCSPRERRAGLEVHDAAARGEPEALTPAKPPADAGGGRQVAGIES